MGKFLQDLPIRALGCRVGIFIVLIILYYHNIILSIIIILIVHNLSLVRTPLRPFHPYNQLYKGHKNVTIITAVYKIMAICPEVLLNLY